MWNRDNPWVTRPATSGLGGRAIGVANVMPRPSSQTLAGPVTQVGGQRWAIANFAFGLLMLAVLVGVAPFQEWVMDGETGSRGDLINQLLHIGIILILLFGSGLVMTRRQLLPLPFSFVILFALCLISLSWSLNPVISLRRLALTVIVCWVIFRCVGDLGYARTLLIVRYALIILIVINYLTVYFSSYGVHPELLGEDSSVVGNWRGILPHKNIAGATCAFTVILLTFDLRRQIPRFIAWPAIVAALVFLAYTESRTSAGMLAFSILCGWMIRPYSANYRTVLGVVVLIAVGIGIQVGSGYIGEVRTFLNDPGSLTGRAAIWPLLLEYSADHPWTGAGFSAFWQIGKNSPIWTLTDNWVAQYAGHGHNGYLDLLVTIGIPGVVLAVVTLLLWPLTRLLLSLSISKPSRSLLVSIVAFCAGHNLTESSMLNGSAVVQVFLVIAVALIYYQSNSSDGAHQFLRRRALRALSVRSPASQPSARAR